MITVCPGENIQRLLDTYGIYGGPESEIDEQFWNAPIRWSMINVNAKWDFGLQL